MAEEAAGRGNAAEAQEWRDRADRMQRFMDATALSGGKLLPGQSQRLGCRCGEPAAGHGASHRCRAAHRHRGRTGRRYGCTGAAAGTRTGAGGEGGTGFTGRGNQTAGARRYRSLATGSNLYLATVIDCFSGRVAGWAIPDHMRTELVEDALLAADALRGSLTGAVFHSDHGSYYTSRDFAERCKDLGVTQSMGGVGWGQVPITLSRSHSTRL